MFPVTNIKDYALQAIRFHRSYAQLVRDYPDYFTSDSLSVLPRLDFNNPRNAAFSTLKLLALYATKAFITVRPQQSLQWTELKSTKPVLTQSTTMYAPSK